MVRTPEPTVLPMPAPRPTPLDSVSPRRTGGLPALTFKCMVGSLRSVGQEWFLHF